MTINKKIILGISFFLIFSFIFPINADIDSPRKQMKEGVGAENVLCKAGLELVIRINGMPACVKPETVDKMQERGILLATKIIKSGPDIETVPASSMSVVNFYITDHDLNLSHRGIEVLSTEGLFEFTINGKQLSQDDIVVIKYLDKSNQSGEQSIQLKSIPLTKTFAELETFGGGSRIGHEFILRLYEPDANRDSRDEDKISISQLEFKSEGGIKTTLANPKFDANSNYLIETGPNTNIFEVQIKIPRQIDGKTIHIGDWYEIKYIDKTTPSNTNEKVIFKGKIG